MEPKEEEEEKEKEIKEEDPRFSIVAPSTVTYDPSVQTVLI